MRADQFISEIISMPPVKKRMDIRQFYNTVLDRVRYHYARKKQSLPATNEFPYEIEVILDIPLSYRFFVMNDNNDPVLYAGMSKMLDGYKTGVVAGDDSISGQGLGYKLYLRASDYLNAPLYSDASQTDSSRYGIWAKLIALVPERIVAYDQTTQQDIPYAEVVDKIYHRVEPKELDDPNSTSRQTTMLLKLLPKSVKVYR